MNLPRPHLWILLAGLFWTAPSNAAEGLDFGPLPLSPEMKRIMDLVLDPDTADGGIDRWGVDPFQGDPDTADGGIDRRQVDPFQGDPFQADPFRIVLDDWMSTSFYEHVREADPLGSFRFMEIYLRRVIDPQEVKAWAEMMPEPAIWEYALLVHPNDPGRVVSLLGRNVPNMEVALDIALREEYRDHVPEEFWRHLAPSIRDTTVDYKVIFQILRRHEPLPRGLLEQAETLIHTSYGGQQWTGLYLMGLRMEEEGTKLRTIAEEICSGGISALPEVLDEVALTPEEALTVAATLSWPLRQGPERRAAFDRLLQQTASLSDEVVWERIRHQPRNLHLLGQIGRRRPELKNKTGEALLRGLKREFSKETMIHFGWILHVSDTSKKHFGLLDEEWLELMDTASPHDVSEFQLAPLLRITPRLLWEKLRDRHAWFLQESRDHFFRDCALYLLHVGDPALIRDVIHTLRTQSLFPYTDKELLDWYVKLYGEMPDGFQEDLFQTRLDMIQRRTERTNPPGLIRMMLGEKIFKKSFPTAGEFFDAHREDLVYHLENGKWVEGLVSVLCILVMDDELRESEGPLFRKAVLDALALAERPAWERSALAMCGLLLGLEEEIVDRNYVRGLSNPEIRYMPVLWLDETHARLLPKLLTAYDQHEEGRCLQAALMIAPSHPEVIRRVEEALMRGSNHELACRLADRLVLLDVHAGLRTYSDERLEWFAHAYTRESFESLVTFLHSLEPGDLDRMLAVMLAVMLPKFEFYAEAKSLKNLGALFRGSPERQRRAADTLIRMLGAKNPHHQDFAARNLATFDPLDPEHLRAVGERLAASADRRSFNGNLLRAVDGTGAGASFLEETVAGLVPSVDPLNRGLALRCLANITVDPDVARRSLEELISMYEETLNTSNGSTFGQSGLVSEIGAVRTRVETVVPFLRSVVETYLNPEPSKKVESYSANRAVWALARRSGKEDMFTYCRELLRRMPGDPRARKLSRPALWCLVNHYGHRLPELRPELDNLPFTEKLLYPYRKIIARLPPRSPE